MTFSMEPSLSGMPCRGSGEEEYDLQFYSSFTLLHLCTPVPIHSHLPPDLLSQIFCFVIKGQIVQNPFFFFCNQIHPPVVQSFSTLTASHVRHVRPFPFPEIAQLFWALQVSLFTTDVHDEH